jgi:uncharacterized membrane protein
VTRRIAAIDWMRGFVMVLMTVDHASMSFNAGRLATDSAYLLDPATGAAAWVSGTELPLAQFLTRWITHLCAPTFLFLSGTALALSTDRRIRAGATPGQIDRHLLIRGAVVLGFEGLLSLLSGFVVLQVLFAIGVSLWAMIALRRLPTPALVVLGLGWFVVGEWVTRSLVPIGTSDPPLVLQLLIVPRYARITVLYPALPWLAMMALGWAFGRWLQAAPPGSDAHARAVRCCARAGALALSAFVVIRGLDGYGNMGLHREAAGLAQWLHVSKYPPAASFALLQLGLMALILAAWIHVERRRARPVADRGPLLVFGQTALFFYVLHLPLLAGAAIALTGGIGKLGLAAAWLAVPIALAVLYPVCLGYRRYKRAHPQSWAAYV